MKIIITSIVLIPIIFFGVLTFGEEDIPDSIDTIPPTISTSFQGPMNISELNSPKSDYAPFIMPDGHTIYFSSIREGGSGGEDIYVSYWTMGRWEPPENIGEPINTRFNEGAMCISPNGKEMYLTICGRKDSYGGCDLYVSYRKKKKWSEPRNMGRKINSTWWDGHPSLSPGGDTLYFASDKFGGFGGLDIYYSVCKDGEWEKPKTLGYPINNARDQTSPLLHLDGRTLYFSSSGHGGFGALDVFLTRLDTIKWEWSEPINIGPPINTSGNDYFFAIPASGHYIYFASDRTEGYGGFDIFSYPLEEWQRPGVVATLMGQVVDAEDGFPILAAVRIERLNDGFILAETTTDSISGHFFTVLRAGETYGISVSAEGYAFSSENYEVKIDEGYNELKHTFRLKKIETGAEIELSNIFFDFAKSELRPESEAELERVVKLLEKYPNMKIEVQGFADSIGSKQFNLFLSRERARAVAEWIINSSISKKRVIYKGFGEEEQGRTEEELQKSRRAQFLILEVGEKVVEQPSKKKNSLNK